MIRVRPAHHTVALIDDYCAHFRPAFHNVWHYEQFTQIILGLVAETKRKPPPRLARSVQGEARALHHFQAHVEWSVDDVQRIRLGILRLNAVPGNSSLGGSERSSRSPTAPTWQRIDETVRPSGY